MVGEKTIEVLPFFYDKIDDAIIEAKTGKLTLSDTLVPGYVTHAKRREIIDLLSKIENSR